jgi:xylulokinase
MSKEKYILAHDAGTGGDKAVLTDLKGHIIHSFYQPYSLNYPNPGWVEQDPDELWGALARSTKQLIRESGIDTAEIIGVGISAQMFNLLPVNKNVEPLMPMISWLDSRTTKEADRILEDENLLSSLYECTGNVPTAKDIIPRIIWLREKRPQLWDKTTWLLDCKEYLIYRLTGNLGIDWHGASVYFLLNPYSKSWSEEACDLLEIPVDKLPPTHPCTDVIGAVTKEAAEATGLKHGTPVVACAGDVAVAQAGSGANADGDAHLCVGTATWVGLTSNRFENDIDKRFWALSHIDPNKWIIAGEMETGGGALMWFRDSFCQAESAKAAQEGISTYKLISDMAEETKPGADGLLFAPWLAGERTLLDHYARGAFVGLSLSHGKQHLARAIMEGVGYHIRWICDSLEKLDRSIKTIRAIGGGCESVVWTQIISDVTGRELEVLEHPTEIGAIGAAFTVAVGVGVYSSIAIIDDLIDMKRKVEPCEASRVVYDEQYNKFRTLHESLAPVYRNLH